MAERFVARYSFWKTTVMLVFAIGLAGIGILAPTLGFETAPGSEWKRWAIVAAGAIGGFLLLRILFDDRPQIVLDAETLIFRRWSARPIPWSEILDFQLISEWIGDTRKIHIRVHNPGAYPPRYGQRLGSTLGGFQIRLHGYDRNADEILEAFARFAPKGLQKPEYREL